MHRTASSVLTATVLAMVLIPMPASAELVGNGTVIDVNWPGQGNVKNFDVANGDTVQGRHGEYTPQKDTKWVNAGEVYNLLMVTKPKSKAQLFVVFSGTGHETPALEDTLNVVDTLVAGIGTTNQSIREGDRVEIRTQSAQGGGTDVTFDVFRKQASVATFSFVQK